MKEICITCCWEGLVAFAWLALKLAFWPAVVYGVVYAVGAVAFLANLRAKVGPFGRLEVAHDSWAYMLARPYRYGKIKAMDNDAVHYRSDWFKPTSICVIYARLLNALLFVWPVVLVYLGAVSVLGTVVFGVLLGIGYVKPNLAEEGWVEKVKVRDWESWPQGWRFLLRLPFLYYAAAFLLYKAVVHFSQLLHDLWIGLLVLLCLLPALGVIAAVVYISRKVVREKDDETTSVGLAAEYVASKKERWCKLVEIK